MRTGINDMHQLQELVRLHRMGRTAVQVANALNMDRKTERKYRKRIAAAGLLAGDASDLPSMTALKAAAVLRRASPPRQEVSTVAAYTEAIDAFRRAGLGPTAIHGMLVEKHGPDVGSLSAVKRLCRCLKKAAGPTPGDVAIPVHTAPGQQAQVDFGYVGELRDPETGTLRKAWVFLMTLSHSRASFARIVFHQDLPTWLSLHRAAFQWFGGVPREVVPDNLKAAVIRAAFKADEMGALNRSYRDLARSYGFVIDPTPAYSPEKKGKVESAVKYVKGFLLPRVSGFADLNVANERLEAWMRGTANLRLHGTTNCRPQDVLDQVERAALLPLPTHPIVAAQWRELTVGRNSHVVVDKRFYSVPWTHLGSQAWVRIRGEALTIYIDSERVADHRITGDTPWSTVPAHLPEGRRDLADRDPENWFRRAQAMGSEVEDYARMVMSSDDVHYPLRRVQSIVMKLEKLTPERAVSVAKRAARFGATRPDAVARIISEQLDLGDQPSDGFLDPRWAKSSRFARAATEFLAAHGGPHASA